MFVEKEPDRKKKIARANVINLNPNEICQDCFTIHLWLVGIDMIEVVIILMIYLVGFVFQIEQDANLNVFSM